MDSSPQIYIFLLHSAKDFLFFFEFAIDFYLKKSSLSQKTLGQSPPKRMGRGIIGARGDSRARTLLNKHGDIRREEGIVRISYREAQTAHKRHGLKRAKNACFGGKKRGKKESLGTQPIETQYQGKIEYFPPTRGSLRNTRFSRQKLPDEACSIGLRSVFHRSARRAARHVGTLGVETRGK